LSKKDKEKKKADKVLDGIQSALDIVGMIPVIGEPCDLANVGISIARGDFTGAAISLVSMIPGLGASGPLMKALSKLPPAAVKAITELMERFAKLLKTLSKNKIVNGAFDMLDELFDILRKYLPDKIMKQLDKFKCEVLKRGCFAKGTLVYTPLGHVPIEEIKVGDMVYAKDPDTGEFDVKEVTELSLQHSYVLYNVTMGDETIGVTAEHPFWVYGKGFVSVEDLVVGDEIVIHNETNTEENGFDLVSVTAIEKVFYEDLQPIYNFTVEDWHSYFVGGCCVWVHNGVKCKTLKPGKFATESIPSRGKARNFTKDERKKINKIGETYGCHTCGTTVPGTKSGNFIPDHQPPNATVADGTLQQLYPHCKSCSASQGGTLSQMKRRGEI
jgi:hypothetical protein